MNAAANNPSVYGDGPDDITIESHTLSIFVDNEPGVLARVIGLFSGRGYNIESLTVAEIDHIDNISRITIISRGTPQVIEQIKHQLERMVPVHQVFDLTLAGPHINHELVLIKILCEGEKADKAREKAKDFDAREVDTTPQSMIFQIAGSVEDIENFLKAMRPFNITNISRTGSVAMLRGPKTLVDFNI
ncbi:MAG: acetolactate synthase small subunit [Pseudomonadota bacterium]